MQSLEVDLADRSYPIFIGAELLEQRELIEKYLKASQVMVVSNETVAPLYIERLRKHFSGNKHYHEIILPDGEQYKNLASMELIYNSLLENRHNRTTTIIALGGGVIGDMSGFAAASYQRGVRFIQIPTTLLSQVDSSVGGKTGVNHPLGKNMIGAFHQPHCVVADTDTLKTLPPRELAAGLAEVIKYGLIADLPFYEWLEANIAGLVACDEALMTEAIYRSCQNKAKVVAADERESGVRAILNLGHTFGHAIETAKGYGNWLHGEAVAVGMLMALQLSSQLGWIASKEVDRLRNLLLAAKLPVDREIEMTQDEFISLMSLDKKVIDGSLRLVLLKSVGDAIVTAEATEEQIRETLLHFGVK